MSNQNPKTLTRTLHVALVLHATHTLGPPSSWTFIDDSFGRLILFRISEVVVHDAFDFGLVKLNER
jgi:hypothetical protein